MVEIGDIIHVRHSPEFNCKPAIVTGKGLASYDVTMFDRTNLNGATRGIAYEGPRANYHYPSECPDRAPKGNVDGPTG